MANISDLLNKIKSARYGRDVRSAIYDSIDAMNTESANAYDAAITAQNSAQASAKAASGSVTSATEAATNAKKYSDSAKQYAESASVAIQAAYDTKTTTDKYITNAVDAPMMVTKFTKNLLNPALATTTSNGVTCTKNNDGTYTLNGTATSFTYFYLVTAIENNFSGLKYIGAPEGSNWNTYFLWGMYRDKNKAETANLTSYNSGTIIESKEKYPYLDFRIAIRQGQTFNNLTFKPMLTTDIEATYEDYVPSSGYEIKTCGKNLLPISSIESRTVNGVTFTNNGDGTYTLNGTATNDAKFSLINQGTLEIIQVIDGKTFKVTGFKETGNYRLECSAWLSTGGTYVFDSRIWNVPNGAKGLRIDIVVLSGAVLNNVVVKPMLTTDLEAIYDDFEPYEGTSIQVTSDTQEPVYGLNSYEGITHVISDGKVTSSYALTDTGKYVMQCMKDINDLKASAATSA